MFPGVRWTSYALVVAVAVGFFAARVLPSRFEEHSFVVLGSTVTLTVAAVLFVMVFAGLREHAMPLRRAVHRAMPPTVLVLAALALYLLVETDVARVGIATLVAGLLLGYSGQLSLADEEREEEQPPLTHILHAVSSFFFYAFAFGVTQYLPVHPAVVAALLGSGIACLAIEAFSAAGMRVKEVAVPAFALGLLGAEFYFAFSFLPTSYIVNAALAVIMVVLVLHVFRQGLRDQLHPLLIRRQFFLSAALAVAVLCTARWA